MFLSALAASNWEKTSRSRSGRANSPEVWGQQKHSGDGRSWRIDDDLEVDRDTRCPTSIPVLRKCQIESELDIPLWSWPISWRVPGDSSAGAEFV